MKWMPPKPMFSSEGCLTSYSLGIVEYGGRTKPYTINKAAFDEWYAKEIAPLFENAEEMLFNQMLPDARLYNCGIGKYDPQPTHKCLLIKIEPIKEETAEDILRELMTTSQIGLGMCSAAYSAAYQKAKAFLEKKK